MLNKDELDTSLELAHETLLQAREIEFAKQSALNTAQLRLRSYEQNLLLIGSTAPEDLGRNETARSAKLAQMTRDHSREVVLSQAELNRARFERETAEITWSYVRKRIDLFGMGIRDV